MSSLFGTFSGVRLGKFPSDDPKWKPKIGLCTCCEPHFSGHKTQLHDGELGQFQFVHSGHSIVPSLPEEHDVVFGVSVYRDYRGWDSYSKLSVMVYGMRYSVNDFSLSYEVNTEQ